MDLLKLFRRKPRTDKNLSQSKQSGKENLQEKELPSAHLNSASDKNLPYSEELAKLCIVFETLNKFKQAGLLYFDFAHHNVTIAQVLAEFYIYNDEEWQRFLHQLHLWAAYQHSINEYTRLYSKARADGEAEAYRQKNQGRDTKDCLPLTDAERQLARLRASQRFDADLAASPVVPLPDVHFYVLGIADGKPIVVARLINGKYETAAVPEVEEDLTI